MALKTPKLIPILLLLTITTISLVCSSRSPPYLSQSSLNQKPVFEAPPRHDALPNPIPPPQPPYYQRYDLVISKVQETGRRCHYAADCPAQSVCYLNGCFCELGYQYINASNQCWRKVCDPYRSDCPYYFPNSECVPTESSYSPETSGHCVCLYSYAVNSFGLSCQDVYQITPSYVWRKVLGYLTLTLFLPILGVVVILVVLAWIAYLVAEDCLKSGGGKRRKKMVKVSRSNSSSTAESGAPMMISALVEQTAAGNNAESNVQPNSRTSSHFELEQLNGEPKKGGGGTLSRGSPPSLKSSTTSIQCLRTTTTERETAVPTKVYKTYFTSSKKSSQLRGSSSPV